MIALLYPKPVVKLKPNITDFSEDELKDWAQQKNEKPFRVNQLLQWLYHHRASSFDQMSNLSKDFRSKLSDFFSFQLPEIVKTQEADDGTIKFLQKLSDQSHIESVLLKHDDHNTLCISTQVGCGMGCRFCLTGKMGLKRNLSSGEIVEQVLNAYRLIPPGETIRNIVYMGMGEPFHNYDNTIKSLGTLLNPLGFDASARRITVSTCGLIPEIKRFAREKFKANLAVSLNGVYEKDRQELMPINRKHSLEDLIGACRELTYEFKNRVTFEYVLLDEVTDSLVAAKKLVGLMHGIRSKINLIAFNEHPDLEYRSSTPENARRFQRYLLDHGLLATIRTPRGNNIHAACGQLAGNS